jgi:hypothetical protein
MLTALLCTDAAFPNNDFSKDRILERSEESVPAAPGPLVTLTFTGTITEVEFPTPAPAVFADVAVGDRWTLTYTFDAATIDIDPNTNAGHYRNPVTDMTLKIRSTTVSGAPGQALPGEYSSLIGVNLGPGYADYTVMAGLPDASAWAQVILTDEIGTPFSDDSIKLSIPTPLEANFPTQRDFLLRAPGTTDLCIRGVVEGTVPPPDYIIGSMIDDVDALVSSSVLEAGVGTSLTWKLEVAIDLLGRDNYHAASKMLGAFIGQVEALVTSGRLPEEEGQELIALGQEVIESLSAA